MAIQDESPDDFTKSTQFTAATTVITAEWLNWVNKSVQLSSGAFNLELEQRVNELEQRVSVLEGATNTSGSQDTGGVATDGTTEEEEAAPTSAASFDFVTGQTKGSEAMPAASAFTARATTAYRYSDTGILINESINAARWNYSAALNLEGLFVEKTVLNKCLYGSKPGSTGWTIVGSGATITADNATSPINTTTATTVVFPASGVTFGSHLVRQGITVSGTLTIARSVWLKSLEAGAINLTLRTSNGADLEVINVPTYWKRFDVTGVIPGAYINFDIGSYGAENHSQSYAVWGACCYEDEDNINWSDYYNTGGSTGSRANDQVTFTVTAGTYNIEIDWDNGTKQTLNSVDCTGGTWLMDPDTFTPQGTVVTAVNFVDPTASGTDTTNNTGGVGSSGSNTSGLNSLTTMKQDMTTNNVESPLYRYAETNPGRNASWSKYGITVQGGDCRGLYVPSYYGTVKPGFEDYTLRDYWTDLFPWFVLWTGTNHGTNAPNTRVMIEKFQVLVLYDGNDNWQYLSSTNGTNGALYPRSVAGDGGKPGIDRKAESNNRFSYKKLDNGVYGTTNPLDGDYIIHGWHNAGFLNTPNPGTVRGVMSRLVASLVLDDAAGTDDRTNADYQVACGLDRYPGGAHNPSTFPNGFIPSAGTGRFKRVTIAPQDFYFCNVKATGSHEEGFPMSSTRQWISEVDFDATTVPQF